MSGLNWEGWEGPLIAATNNLQSSFITNLLHLSSPLPPHSLHIAQSSIAHGGLGFYRPSATAIPNFVLTMAKATNYAQSGIRFHSEAPNYQLPSDHITSLFNPASNPSSLTLQRFHHAMPTIALIAVSHRVPYEQHIDHFLNRTSSNSARHRLRLHTDYTTTSLVYNDTPSNLRHLLPGVLSPHMSYPLIHMSRSNPKHHLSNADFLLMLKRKLLLAIYHPASAPTCKCGKTHDIYGNHHFRCRQISKKAAHNSINEYGLQPILQNILPTAGIIPSSSIVETEVEHHIPANPLLRPYDIEWKPSHGLNNSDLPPSPFTVCGADLTIDHSPEPSQPSDTEDIIISFYSANAARCLQKAEKRKFKDMGNDTVTPGTVTREDVLQTLLTSQKHLQIWAICPHGGLGPMFRRFLYGEEPQSPLTFTANTPHATNMYLQPLQAYAPHGVLPLANAAWSATRRDNQRFYGHSYTAPTPQVNFLHLQQLGLACTKAFAAHLRRQSRKQSSSPTQAGPNSAPPGLSSPFSDPRA